jgi:hypothetical protein
MLKIYLMLTTFHGAIHCCILPGFSFVNLVFIGNNDPKLKSKSRSKKIMVENYFVTEHFQSCEVELEAIKQPVSLSTNGSTLLSTSCAGEYIV